MRKLSMLLFVTLGITTVLVAGKTYRVAQQWEASS